MNVSTQQLSISSIHVLILFSIISLLWSCNKTPRQMERTQNPTWTLNLDTLTEAHLAISSQLQNHTNQNVSGVLEGQIEEKTIPTNGSPKLHNLSDIPQIKGLTGVYFLDLKLRDNKGKQLAENFYWLSTKADLLEESKTTWFVTPQKQFADFTALNQMERVNIDVHHKFSAVSADNQQSREVTLKNPTDKIAFFIELKVVDEETGKSILPVLWNNNCISLLPGESKTINATYPVSGPTFKPGPARTFIPVFKFSGWNVAGSSGS